VHTRRKTVETASNDVLVQSDGEKREQSALWGVDSSRHEFQIKEEKKELKIIIEINP
jgi:hypothetical protein